MPRLTTLHDQCKLQLSSVPVIVHMLLEFQLPRDSYYIQEISSSLQRVHHQMHTVYPALLQFHLYFIQTKIKQAY